LPERRKAVGGLLFSLALTSLLTGVTEPIEFTFIFLAPLLYAVHAVLTGLSMVLMDALGVKLGFGFSAGLFDYVLNYGLSTKALMLFPVGALYFAVYYFTFSWCIRRFNLATPGREPAASVPATATTTAAGDRGHRFVAALGGKANLQSIDACMTRLRLVLADTSAVDEAALKSLGARGIVRPGGNSLQVVVGPIADQLAQELRSAGDSGEDLAGAIGRALKPAQIRAVSVCDSRLAIDLDDSSRIDASALNALPIRGWVAVDGGVQIIIGPEAEAIARQLKVSR
jgi:PTS system N-acetylglucosamine-specific IIC component